MKIHELPLHTRKVILWGVVIAIGLILFFFWGQDVIKVFKDISLPEIPKEIEESFEQTQEQFIFPSFQDLEIPEELLQAIEEENGTETGQ